MSAKHDLILAYIESLKPSSKVSVRELSDELHVSEGTAYKAIKEAERRGLVAIRPKSGTVRLETNVDEVPCMSVERIVSILRLSVVAGKGRLDRRIKAIIICDGSETEILRQMKSCDRGNCLCLCGDRQEIQQFVLEQGACLLLTSGAKADQKLIALAEERKLCILSTHINSVALIKLLYHEYPETAALSPSNRVEDWMQAPDYLYYNDMVADWHRMYAENDITKQYPIVDDDLKISGGLDLWQAAVAVPSQRIDTLRADQVSFPTFAADEDIRNAAKKLALEGESLAAVVKDGKLAGILTPGDIMRYYLYRNPNVQSVSGAALLLKDKTVPCQDITVFRIQFPLSGTENLQIVEMDLLLSATADVLWEKDGSEIHIESGTFYTGEDLRCSDDLVLVCKTKQTDAGIFLIEAEINDSKTSYAKSFIIASKKGSSKGV